MMYDLDNTHFPAFLATLFPTLANPGDFIWSVDTLAITKRTSQKGSAKGNLFPFVSFVRDNPLTIDRERFNQLSYYAVKHSVGPSDQVLLTAVPIAFSYKVALHTGNVRDIVDFEKLVVFAMHNTHQFHVAYAQDTELGVDFNLGAFDSSGKYITEEVYERGYLNHLYFGVDVKAWAFKTAAAGPRIETITSRIYGYNGNVVDASLMETKVIT